MIGDFRRGERYAPGVYAYRGELHVDEEEFILGTGGNPEDPRDVVACRKAIARVCGERGVPVEERVR